MGTALTGLEIKDTYDSLIKVTDNGPISGTLKALSDGLGNDSTLSLSTTAASIAGTLAVTGNATFDTSTLFVDAAANEVGIGTITPSAKLDVDGTSYVIVANNSLGNRKIKFGVDSVAGEPTIQAALTNDTTRQLLINPEGGNVGIGATTTPAVPLDVVGNIRSSTGILFGSDTAAANLLDDYEEGTWTMGITFGGNAVGVTYGSNTGAYTKIGRKVTVTGYLSLSNKGSSTGAALITGLPFAIGTGTQFPAAAPAFFVTVSYTGITQIVGLSAASVLECFQLSALGSLSALTNSNFANSSEVYVSFTYFV